MAPITTQQIYWGSVPFVLIQIIMVAILIFWPGLVLDSVHGAAKIDPSTIQIELPPMDENEPPPVEFK